MRILVCGGRDFDDRKFLYQELEKVAIDHLFIDGNENPTGVQIISGMARGADTLAVDWAKLNYCEVLEYPADWDKHGKAAGPIRNQEMLEQGKPDLVLAFPGGRGTAHMVRIAEQAGVEVRKVGW